MNNSFLSILHPLKPDFPPSVLLIGLDLPLSECPLAPTPYQKGYVQEKWTSPDKKKSRKHQRFMTRRALEQKRCRSKGKVKPVTSDASRMGPMQEFLPWEACQYDQLLKEDAVKDHKICVPFPAASVPSVTQDRQPTLSQDLMPQVSLPSSSAGNTGSLFCLMPKRSKKCVAIDCEMVGTGPAGKTSELARCTVVNYNGDVIYDKYIRPELPIVDYRTQWSGITWRHMVNATPFRVAQREILQILRDKIVVGHAIHNDFRALKYFHPEPWTRDTSQSRLLKKKVGLSVKANVSLKSLASQLLCKKIQVSRSGHSSVEDAQTSMELYRLVELQWEEALACSLCSSPPDSGTDSDCYLDDRYWPKDLNVDCK
ncbi:apoptosis-enhancing nuclease isoform X2 [Varanus komodoensis]|uniref:apoptosis-enhancing nuclease isoform X2 n=1 Tax=Varanus komodoensis TaxID=61221 RepID=UPI001CF7823D|nr:apoptosis-enhancing nuclease isoform X2 [Varanus komodoensis]